MIVENPYLPADKQNIDNIENVEDLIDFIEYRVENGYISEDFGRNLIQNGKWEEVKEMIGERNLRDSLND